MGVNYPVNTIGITAPQFRHPSPPHSTLTINSRDDDRPVVINSRDYGSSSGNNIGMQCKPNQAAGTGSSITGAEFSPRFADGVGGAQLRAIAASPFLKGTTGDLTSNVEAIEAEMDLGSNSTRTIAGGVYVLRVITNFSVGLTVTGGKHIIHVDAPEAGGTWDSFLEIPDTTSTGLIATTAGAGASEYLVVKVGSNIRKIALLATA